MTFPPQARVRSSERERARYQIHSYAERARGRERGEKHSKHVVGQGVEGGRGREGGRGILDQATEGHYSCSAWKGALGTIHVGLMLARRGGGKKYVRHSEGGYMNLVIKISPEGG